MEKQMISDKAVAVINAIAQGGNLRHVVAEKLGVSIPTVNGSLNSLRRNGLVEIDDDLGTLTLTGDAKQYIIKISGKRASDGAVTTERIDARKGPRPDSKMAKAKAIYEELAARGRAAVIANFRELGLSKAGAATYYQTIRVEQLAYQKKNSGESNGSPPVAK